MNISRTACSILIKKPSGDAIRLNFHTREATDKAVESLRGSVRDFQGATEVKPEPDPDPGINEPFSRLLTMRTESPETDTLISIVGAQRRRDGWYHCRQVIRVAAGSVFAFPDRLASEIMGRLRAIEFAPCGVCQAFQPKPMLLENSNQQSGNNADESCICQKCDSKALFLGMTQGQPKPRPTDTCNKCGSSYDCCVCPCEKCGCAISECNCTED